MSSSIRRNQYFVNRLLCIAAGAFFLCSVQAQDIPAPPGLEFAFEVRAETAAPELEWLMRSIFVSTGERYPNGVIIRYWRVL